MQKNYTYKLNTSIIMEIRGIKVLNYNTYGNNSVSRIKNNTLIICADTACENDLYYKILYVNNGGSLIEGFIKKTKANKFIEMRIQLCMYSISPKRRELEILLASESDKDYNNYISKLVNDRIKETENYKKLYNYWKNICYDNKEASRELKGDHFVNISYDYEKIKKSKKKIHIELLRNFKLYK